MFGGARFAREKWHATYVNEILLKNPKIAIFRCLKFKNHVKIELEIWKFSGRLEIDQIDCKNFKFQEYRWVGFLEVEPLFYNRLWWSV